MPQKMKRKVQTGVFKKQKAEFLFFSSRTRFVRIVKAQKIGFFAFSF